MERQVEAANAAFYEAFERLDGEALAACWEHSERATCLHPGGRWLHGWAEIGESWDAILLSTPYIEVEVTDVRVRVEDPVGWVTCVELVRAPGAASVSELAACNMFVLGQRGWRMVSHQASPVLRSD